MADFSLTTLFVVPSTQAALPTTGTSTQDLGAGIVGFFTNLYKADTGGNIAAAPYFYVAQGRQNTYLQGSKRSDKIKGCDGSGGAVCSGTNVTEYYKLLGCAQALTQITEVSNFHVQCADVITLTIRAHSSYIDTLYFNGFTRSVTISAPCCACPPDNCADIDAQALVDKLIAKLQEQAPGNNPDNISFNTFFTFARSGTGTGSKLVITGKALTKYGQPCDVAAFPHEYDRMWFRTFVYEGPATTADFIVADNCNIVATSTVTQRSSYPVGTSEEIKQLQKNYYSYQAGYLKHLYRMMGYNENYEDYVVDGLVYDTYYIKFNEYDRAAYQWGDYIPTDQMVIIAVPSLSNGGTVPASAMPAAIDGIMNTVFGATANTALNSNLVCPTTTTTTTGAGTTTTTTSLTTLIP